MESTQIDTKAGVRQTNNNAGADVGNTSQRQQELLGFLFECESLAQDMVSATPNSALMEHAVELCEGYLKTMLDMLQVWQRLQRAQALGSDLQTQLEQMRTVLRDVSQQASRNARRDQNKAAQARYWNTVGGLIDEVLRLSRQQQQSLLHAMPDSKPTADMTSNCPCGPEPEIHQQEQTQPALQLTTHLFGKFKASLNGREIKRWPRGKGLKILKYLLLHRSVPIPKERLMEIFWSDTDAHAARNNLNVALYHLRQDFSRYHKTFPFVHYRDGCYLLNPELAVWVDVEVFEQYIRTAQQHDARRDIAQAISAYRSAEALYQGDCLLEDRHEEWAALLSQAYRLKYLNVLEYLGARTLEAGDYQECAALWQKAVALDNCNEQAHQHIMRCYLKMGQRQMALRQYQLCEEALKKELGLEPAAQTRQLLEHIRQAGG